jgi:hypothetical protein
LYVQRPRRQLWNKAQWLTCSHCSSSPILVSFTLPPKCSPLFSSPASDHVFIFRVRGLPFLFSAPPPFLGHHQLRDPKLDQALDWPYVRVQNAPLQLKAREKGAAGFRRIVQLDQMLPSYLLCRSLLFLDHSAYIARTPS